MFPPVEQKMKVDLNRKLSILLAFSSTRCDSVGHGQEILNAERAKRSMGRVGRRNPIKGNTEETAECSESGLSARPVPEEVDMRGFVRSSTVRLLKLGLRGEKSCTVPPELSEKERKANFRLDKVEQNSGDILAHCSRIIGGPSGRWCSHVPMSQLYWRAVRAQTKPSP